MAFGGFELAAGPPGTLLGLPRDLWIEARTLSNSSVSRLSIAQVSLSRFEDVDSPDFLISSTIPGSLEPCVLRKVLFTMANSSVSKTPAKTRKIKRYLHRPSLLQEAAANSKQNGGKSVFKTQEYITKGHNYRRTFDSRVL